MATQSRIGWRKFVPSVYPLITANMVMNLDAQNYTSGTWLGTSSTTLNATLNNGVVFSNEAGGCMYLDGYNDYFTVPYDSTFEFTNGTNDLPFTMTGWFRMFDSNGGPLISKTDSGSNQILSYSINVNSSSVFLVLYNNSNNTNYGGKTITASASIAAGTWNHYAVSYSGSVAIIYINGSPVSSTVSTWGTYTRMTPSTLPLYIGSFGTNGAYHGKFRGEIGQQMIYNNILSATEVYQNYMATKERFTALNLLDIFKGAISAHSIRKIRSSYSGACLRVRRSSDNTELDIEFDGSGNLNTSTLLAFVGAGDGYVTKWYDQSGSNNMEQPVASRQLRIVSTGTLETLNGKPALYKADANSSMAASFGMTYSTPNAIYSVLSFTAGAGESYIMNSPSFKGSFASGQLTLNAGSSISFPHSPGILTQGIYSFTMNGSPMNSRVNFNNARGVYSNAGYHGNLSGLYLGATGSSQMKIQEVVAYDLDQDWNRTGITDNMNSYFSSYTKLSDSGLIAYYDTTVSDSYPGTGNVVYDLSSSNNNTTLNGALIQNGGIYFDGINDYSQSTQNLSLEEAPKTFVVWMKQTNTKGGQICCLGGAGSGQLFELISGSAGFEGHFWGVGYSFGVSAGKNLINTYTHVAMTYTSSRNGQAGKTIIYVDGVEKGNYNNSLLNWNNQPFYICKPAYSGTSYYNGYIYSVKLYNKSLTAAQILADFNGTKSKFGL